jgi:hypothetical protein
MSLPKEPNSREERYLSKMAGENTKLPDEPITRKEFYLAKAAGQDVNTPNPTTRIEMYLDVIAQGGGGGSSVLVDKTITANGEYDPADDNADGYSSVAVNVPNSYAAGDEGKVVSNGALVSQSSATYTENGTYDTTLKNSVTVNVAGGAAANPATVEFRDYDGTLLHKYTATEFDALTELPANPTHSGLTAQGWNWTLADAKLSVENEQSVVIGQHYVTDDGKTRIYITLPADALSPKFSIYSTGTTEVDWGDGSTPYTVTTSTDTFITQDHTYPDAGDYVITIETTGRIYLTGYYETNTYVGTAILYTISGARTYAVNSYYQPAIKRIEIGQNTYINYAAFMLCSGLAAITMPRELMNGVLWSTFRGCSKLPFVSLSYSNGYLEDYAFYGCSKLQSISISEAVTSVGAYAFYGCSRLTSAFLPSGVTSIGDYAYQNCYRITSVNVPSSLTTIGQLAFSGCKRLSVVPFPSGLTSIGSQAFQNCSGLTKITIPDSVTSIGSSAFNSCTALFSIKLPSDATSYGGFSGCTALREVNIPDNATTIESTSFKSCPNLFNLEIPSGVTSIGTMAFMDSTSMERIVFKPTTPPTISVSSSANTWPFKNNSATLEVPYSEDHSILAAYESAENYPPANRIVEASAP